ncbi:hypothetical protein ON010_g4490 [Phytophthora cinnamomi]|nr:hypothetical protein ON010_g4490 [Phytophthora cinnamomi]
MKARTTCSAFAVALTVCFAGPTDGYLEVTVQRQLILDGETVPSGSKTYMTSLRSSPTSNNICGGSLISPTHVLSASHCSVLDIRWVSIGSYYRNGSQDGEQIRVVSLMNHPNYSENVRSSRDFMVLELDKPSKFTPIKLAAADDSDFKVGKWATTMGWGTNAEVNGTNPYEPQKVDIALISDDECAKQFTTDSSMVCGGGALNRDSCFGDSGGPLVVQGANNVDVLIGVVSTSKDNTCGREGYFGIYSRVSSVRAWIDSITGGNVLDLPYFWSISPLRPGTRELPFTESLYTLVSTLPLCKVLVWPRHATTAKSIQFSLKFGLKVAISLRYPSCELPASAIFEEDDGMLLLLCEAFRTHNDCVSDARRDVHQLMLEEEWRIAMRAGHYLTTGCLDAPCESAWMTLQALLRPEFSECNGSNQLLRPPAPVVTRPAPKAALPTPSDGARTKFLRGFYGTEFAVHHVQGAAKHSITNAAQGRRSAVASADW